jgi:Spy/CpxP family protein refolding chaperone
MRKTIVVAALLAAVTSATALHAQGNPPGGGRRGGMGRGGMGPGMMDNELFKGITLSDAQKAKVEQIREAERTKMQAESGGGRAEADSARAARQRGDTALAQRLMAEQRAKMEVRRDAQFVAIRGILTADQLPQFDANVAEMKKRAAEMGGRGRRGGPPMHKP